MKNKQQVMKQTNRVYDTPFFVDEEEVIQDENGIQRIKWKQKYKLLAAANNLYGKEYELAKQRTNQKTIKFITPYGPRIDETMRIRFQDKIYDIDNVDNIGYKNQELEIKAIERVMSDD